MGNASDALSGYWTSKSHQPANDVDGSDAAAFTASTGSEVKDAVDLDAQTHHGKVGTAGFSFTLTRDVLERTFSDNGSALHEFGNPHDLNRGDAIRERIGIEPNRLILRPLVLSKETATGHRLFEAAWTVRSQAGAVQMHRQTLDLAAEEKRFCMSSTSEDFNAKQTLEVCGTYSETAAGELRLSRGNDTHLRLLRLSSEVLAAPENVLSRGSAFRFAEAQDSKTF